MLEVIVIDIIVTIPKSEYGNDDRENKDINEKGYNAFWTLSVVPKKLKIGDRVYFVKNNKVNSSMRVIEIITDSTMTCDTTKRTWKGKCQILMDDFKEENIPNIKGFQGFRYKVGD